MKNYILKNKYCIIGLILLLFNSCSSQRSVYTSFWQVKDFTITDYKELQNPLRFCDRKSKLQYNITNDDKKIYICLKVIDKQYQMKIIRAGMVINIDTMGKKRHPISISFPIARNDKPKMPTDIKQGQEKSNLMKMQFQLDQKEMQLTGFNLPINGIVPLKNNYGIYINIDWDSLNVMYYKAIIPFNTFYKETLSCSDSMKVFDFTFTVNAIEMPENNMGGPPREGDGGERPGGGNMSGGKIPNRSGMGNGGPPQGRGEGIPPDNSLSEKNIFMLKIKMAVKK